MKEQIVTEILHYLPDLPPDQQHSVRDAVRLVLCNYEISRKETTLQTVDNSSLYYLRLYLESIKQSGKSQGTINLYKFHLSHMLSYLNKNVTDITDDDVYLYMHQYRTHRKVSNSYLDQLRLIYLGFFKFLVKKRVIQLNPVDPLEKIKSPQKIKKPLSSRDMEYIRSSCSTERDLAIIECLYSSAVRVSELISLNREDVSFITDDVIVFGKGSKERITYFNAKALVHLRNYLESRTDHNPALFVSSRKPYERLTRRGVEDILKRLGTAAGIDKVHPHRFRRTSATDLLNAGMPLEQVQELLGHKSIATTRIYCTVNQEAVKQNHRRYMNF